MKRFFALMVVAALLPAASARAEQKACCGRMWEEAQIDRPCPQRAATSQESRSAPPAQHSCWMSPDCGACEQPPV